MASEQLKELSPLDQIRHAESEVTRRIAAAREAARQTVESAQARASVLREEAQHGGRQEGLARYREQISNAEERARIILSQAQDRADDLQSQGGAHMTAAVRQAIVFILRLQ
jgi:vacuolar-type H+-ATPase subunit H